ncbi:LysR family transcriptional regulator [Methylocapsa aurea]|uniref:LysR family transcriptional regulator n=1 Tax=Methylocapsa aurea TaxID=663610 RepID=UPI00055C8A54|nr:LysR family transcriptional regulator [Methylocapsa aurea]
MDRLESMSILLEAVEAGSLSAAARRLGMPLATVSRKVSELEAHLKTRLFTRSARRLALTDAGSSYAIACKRILEDVNEAERAASGEYSAPKGDLIITAPIVFGRLHVLPVAMDFLNAYSDISIRIVQTDRVIDLLDDHVDLAVRIGELPDSSLVAAKVGSIRLVTCASPAYFAKRGAPRGPDELSAHECVTFDRLMSPDAWTFRIGKSNAPFAIRSRLVVDTAEAAIDAAIAGIGITRVLSYQIANAVQVGALAMTLQEFEPAPWPVSLVYTRQRLLPLKLRAFLDFAAPRLKARLLQDAL